MENENEEYLVCYPITMLPDPPTESSIAACSQCSAEVWQSNSSPKNMVVMCLPCFLAIAEERGEEIEIMHPTLQQLADINKRKNEGPI